MPSLSLGGQLIYFAHCPKAGGTSVERFMVARWGAAVGHLGWGWDRAWAGRGVRAGVGLNSPQHMIWEDAARALPRSPAHVFAVVRDPVARMISEYRYQRAGRLTGPAGRPLRRLSFSDWLPLMLALAARQPWTHDNHFRPQSAFLPGTGATLFRLEDGLSPVAAWLCRTLGEAPDTAGFPHALKAGDGADPVTPSRQDLALIAEAYAEDYARLSYPRPDPGSAPHDPKAARRAARARALAPLVAALYRRGLI